MRNNNRFGWILVGVLIGTVASTTLRGVATAQEQTSRRLLILRTASPGDGVAAYFIKDTATGACWLSVRTRDDMGGSLAPAPPVSCQQ